MGQKENTEQCSAAACPPGGCCDQLLCINSSSFTPSRESYTTTRNSRLIHCCLLKPRMSMPQGGFFSHYLLLLRCRGAERFGDRRRSSSPQPVSCFLFIYFTSCCRLSAGQREQLCHPAVGFGAELGVSAARTLSQISRLFFTAARTTEAAGPLPAKQPLLHLTFCKVLLPEILPKYCNVLTVCKQFLQPTFVSPICHLKHTERGVSALQSFCPAGLMLRGAAPRALPWPPRPTPPALAAARAQHRPRGAPGAAKGSGYLIPGTSQSPPALHSSHGLRCCL